MGAGCENSPTDDRNERVGVKFSDSDLIGLQSVSLLVSGRWHCRS